MSESRLMEILIKVYEQAHNHGFKDDISKEESTTVEAHKSIMELLPEKKRERCRTDFYYELSFHKVTNYIEGYNQYHDEIKDRLGGVG